MIRPVLRNWQKGVLWTCLQTDGIGETAQGRHRMLGAPPGFPLAFFAQGKRKIAGCDGVAASSGVLRAWRWRIPVRRTIAKAFGVDDATRSLLSLHPPTGLCVSHGFSPACPARAAHNALRWSTPDDAVTNGFEFVAHPVLAYFDACWGSAPNPGICRFGPIAWQEDPETRFF